MALTLTFDVGSRAFTVFTTRSFLYRVKSTAIVAAPAVPSDMAQRCLRMMFDFIVARRKLISILPDSKHAMSVFLLDRCAPTSAAAIKEYLSFHLDHVRVIILQSATFPFHQTRYRSTYRGRINRERGGVRTVVHVQEQHVNSVTSCYVRAIFRCPPYDGTDDIDDTDDNNQEI